MNSGTASCLFLFHGSSLISWSTVGDTLPPCADEHTCVLGQKSIWTTAQKLVSRHWQIACVHSHTPIRPLLFNHDHSVKILKCLPDVPEFTCPASTHASSSRLAPCQSVVLQEAETLVEASLTAPENGGQVRMVIAITQKTPEKGARTLSQERLGSVGGECEVGLPAAV